MNRKGARRHYGPPAPMKERLRAALHILSGKPCVIGVTFKSAKVHEDTKDLLMCHCAFKPNGETVGTMT